MYYFIAVYSASIFMLDAKLIATGFNNLFAEVKRKNDINNPFEEDYIVLAVIKLYMDLVVMLGVIINIFAS